MAKGDWQAVTASTSEGVSLRVKVVPGASRSRIVGMLGDRLKVSVAAPPEAGRANAALCELLADCFGVPARNVLVTEGQTQPRKTVTVVGVSLCAVVEKLRGLGE